MTALALSFAVVPICRLAAPKGGVQEREACGAAVAFLQPIAPLVVGALAGLHGSLSVVFSWCETHLRAHV